MLVNGKNVELKESVTLQAYLDSFGYELPRAAVEKNGIVIPRSSFASEMICNDDNLEIVRFVGGG